MHICQKRGLHLDPQLFLDKRPIPVVEETKFLGVIFDRTLSFVPHLKYVKKALKALNILKVIGNAEWGVDRKVMLRLDRYLVRSKLDNGCIVYGSARKSYLQMLNPVHNHGRWLRLGAFRTSPVESLYVDAHEPCLGSRRAKLSLQYASKIRSLPKHPTHDAVFNKYMKLFDAKPNAIRTFGLRIKQFLTVSNIDFSDILETPSYFILPPWCIKPPKIVLDVLHLTKYRWFTGWKYCACATVFPSDTVLSMRLPDSSVFTAEVWAIIKAMEQIKDSIASKYIVFTDSLSCLQALHRMKLEHPLIRKCVFLNFAKKDMVPSHNGIKSNEKTDFAARFALDLPCTKVGLPYSDFKHCISQYSLSTWQDDWNGAVANKLHSLKPVLGDWQSSYRRCRTDEVVLYRARIGHTHLTHSYILRKDPPPQCEHCQCILTVRHILVECNNFARERKYIYGRRDVVESLRFHPTLIVIF